MIRKKSESGFTLIELVVVLGVLAILTATMVPLTINYLDKARTQRAVKDVAAIGQAITRFNDDVKEYPIWASGVATRPADSKYDILKTAAGDEAAVATGVTFSTTTNAGTLDPQLVTNGVAYPITGVRAWFGPYLETLKADPWGNKYYVTTKFLWPTYRSPGSEKAVYVISAGPNSMIDTNFEQAVTGLTAGGDDVVFRIR